MDSDARTPPACTTTASTRDGLAIARAVAEHIVERIGARTLFATHFHELTRFAHPAFRNYSMDVAEENGKVVFLKRIREGAADHSYGVHVARLAGVPEEVIEEAERLIRDAEAASVSVTAQAAAAPDGLRPDSADSRRRTPGSREPGPEPAESQPALFSAEELVLSEILSAEVEAMRPLDALNAVARWKRELEGGTC